MFCLFLQNLIISELKALEYTDKNDTAKHLWIQDNTDF
jgi:hypothetical protein